MMFASRLMVLLWGTTVVAGCVVCPDDVPVSSSDRDRAMIILVIWKSPFDQSHVMRSRTQRITLIASS